MGRIIDFILLLLLIFAPCKECSKSNFDSLLSFLGKPPNDLSSNGRHKLSFFNDVLQKIRIDAEGNKCISLSEHNYMQDSNGIDVYANEGATSEGKQHLYPLLETISDAAIRGYTFMISPTVDAKKSVGCFSQQQQQQRKLDPNSNSELNPTSLKQLPKSSKPAIIPLTIHQSWKSRNSVPKTTIESTSQHQQQKSHSSLKSSLPFLPPDFSSVRKNTPEFLHILWTDSDINAFIKHYYPQYRSYYDSLDLNIKKMDLSRYLILYQFGGVYVDIDATINNSSILPLVSRSSSWSSSASSPSPASLDDRLEFVSYNPYSLRRNSSAKQRRGAVLSSQYMNFVGNAFFATIPGSGVLKIMISDIVSSSINFQHLVASRKVDVLNHTGPIGLARAVNTFLDLKFKEPSNNLLYSSKKSFMNAQTYVKIVNHQLVGNSNDNPQYVTHYRQHQWGKDAKNLI